MFALLLVVLAIITAFLAVAYMSSNDRQPPADLEDDGADADRRDIL